MTIQENSRAWAANVQRVRRRGRARRPEVDVRILEAVVAELCERGVGGITFDKLALQAGVAKTTIYRRWSNKFDLIIDAIDLLRSRSPVPDTGDVRADLVAGLENMLNAFTSPQGRAIAAVYSECPYNSELNRAWQEKIADPHVAAFRSVLEHGVASGQILLRAGVDDTISILTGFAFFALWGNLPVGPGLARDVVATVIEGIGLPPKS